MTPVIFLGQRFATEKDFKRAYPAYAEYSKLVAAGLDTPQKIEQALHRKNKPGRRGMSLTLNLNNKRRG